MILVVDPNKKHLPHLFMSGLKSINPKGIYPQTDNEVLFWAKAQYFLRVNSRHKYRGKYPL